MSITNRFRKIRKSVDSLITRITYLERKLEQFNEYSFVVNIHVLFDIKNEVAALKRYTSYLHDLITEAEIQHRASDLIISGIPYDPIIKPMEMIYKIGTALNIDTSIGIRNVFSAKTFDVGTGSAKMSIIVQFYSKRLKSLLFRSYKKLGDLNLSHIGMNSYTRIHFNDGLTKQTAQLLQMAKYYQINEKLIYKSYTKFGMLFVIVHVGGRPIWIKNRSCLDQLISRIVLH